MSNYPPGVTGNEPEIAGIPEGSTYKSCDARAVVKILPKGIELQLIDLMSRATAVTEDMQDWRQNKATNRRQTHTLDDLNYRFRLLAQELVSLRRWFETFSSDEIEIELDPCHFEGEVDIQYYEDIEYWECPICGTEHEDTYEGTE